MAVTTPTDHPVTEVAATATVGEARVALARTGQPALPVVGHDGMLGLVTVEALGGSSLPGDGPAPPDDLPVLAVMDWHLVRVPPDADERAVLDAYTRGAWRWMAERSLETEAGAVSGPGRGRRSLWWLGSRR